MAIAVFPVPGVPAIRTARPAIFPEAILNVMTPLFIVSTRQVHDTPYHLELTSISTNLL